MELVNAEKTAVLLESFLRDPLSDEYRAQRRTVLYVAVFLSLMVLTNGTLNSQFGNLAITASTLFFAKLLAAVAVAFLLFAMWQVVTDCFRRWSERWQAEESVFLASLVKADDSLSQKHHAASVALLRERRLGEITALEHDQHRIRERLDEWLAQPGSRQSAEIHTQELRRLQHEEKQVEAKLKTAKESLNGPMDYGETTKEERREAMFQIVRRYGRLNEAEAVSADADTLRIYRLLRPYMRFEELRDRYRASLLKQRHDPIAVTMIAVAAVSFFAFFLKVTEAGASPTDRLLSEMQLWRAEFADESRETRFIWFPTRTNVFTVSFPIFGRTDEVIATTIKPAVSESIRGFLASLAECHQSDAPVVVHFVGYADGKVSNQVAELENVALANSRAAALFALRDGLELGYEASVAAWPVSPEGHRLMRGAMGFADFAEVSGGLGRRADLQVVQAGTCDPARLVELYREDSPREAG